MKFVTKGNPSNGALFIGHATIELRKLPVKMGDKIHIDGETTPRVISHIYGSSDKGWYCSFKSGNGPVQVGGVITFDILVS